MLNRSLIAMTALAALCLATAGAQAFDETKYPDWSGQWRRGEPGPPRYDPSKPGAGLRQEAPLTEEYKVIHAESMADQKEGGQGNDPTYTCIGPGMPRIMSVYDPLEIVITENTTHMLMPHLHRRAQLAGVHRAELRRLLDRKMARYRRGWPLRHARNREPRLQGPARL